MFLLFEVSEEVRVGISLLRDPPSIAQANISVPLLLDQEHIRQLNALPERHVVRLRSSDVAFTPEGLVFSLPSTRVTSKALVRVMTMTEPGGTLTLTATSFNEVYDAETERIVRHFAPFPPAGVTVHGMADEVERLRTGVPESINALFELSAGASFCIRRTGCLSDTPRLIFVRWDGHELTATPPKKFRPRPAHDRMSL